MKMKKMFFAALMITSFASKAQTYVTIPDTNFAAFLQTKYPGCMSGNLMDTSCSTIKNETLLNVDTLLISDLSGIGHFINLSELHCSYNNLTSLPVLPNSLLHLYCGNNQLTSLPALPSSLIYLDCNTNLLSSLPSLPNGVYILRCQSNRLTSLSALPNSLLELDCFSNQLTSLPSLPDSLQLLVCGSNQLTSLPSLPDSLEILECSGNPLNSLPSLTNKLSQLGCSSNQLISLPSLPIYLTTLICEYNQLTNLPSLPTSLKTLICVSNQLTSLPQLPDSLTELDCSFNNIQCFPYFPDKLNTSLYFEINVNPFTCLPNYVGGMDSTTLTYPLCVNGDGINNPTGCTEYDGILGFIYQDKNGNCIKDAGDSALTNVPEKLFDINNNLLGQSVSALNGVYDFPQAAGTYTVAIDTVGLPLAIQCASPGIDSTVTTTSTNLKVTDVNFSFSCKPNFDVGVRSILYSGWVFPGQQHQLNFIAGDLSQWYNLQCAAGISGQIQITVSGPVSYAGTVAGALTPSVSGNTFTYSISDFGTVDIRNSFALLFNTNTTAQAGDMICVSVSVTPTAGDNNMSNNAYQFCYYVVNSYDPNLKEVYPSKVLPGYQDWLTYTIHFQNTGNAAAFNINLVDTLDTNLDLNTFQVLNSSHDNSVLLKGNVLTFHFANIMLPDSNSNQQGSRAFVQYHIKPKAGLPLGTQIKNTANIYFDYNAPVATNTVSSQYVQTLVTNTTKPSMNNTSLEVYPNPGNGMYSLKIPEALNNAELNIKVYNALGELVLNTKAVAGLNKIDLSNLQNGIYILKVDGADQSFSKTLIKQ
jgi:uncharacterized repeat protein (TIGR01451 family)